MRSIPDNSPYRHANSLDRPVYIKALLSVYRPNLAEHQFHLIERFQMCCMFTATDESPVAVLHDGEGRPCICIRTYKNVIKYCLTDCDISVWPCLHMWESHDRQKHTCGLDINNHAQAFQPVSWSRTRGNGQTRCWHCLLWEWPQLTPSPRQELSEILERRCLRLKQCEMHVMLCVCAQVTQAGEWHESVQNTYSIIIERWIISHFPCENITCEHDLISKPEVICLTLWN